MRPDQAAHAEKMNRPPQIIGVSITVRVTVASGRLASGPKNVALSKPARANTAASVMSSGPYAESDGGTAACWPPAPVTIIRPTMNSNEHDSTARMARAANRTPADQTGEDHDRDPGVDEETFGGFTQFQPEEAERRDHGLATVVQRHHRTAHVLGQHGDTRRQRGSRAEALEHETVEAARGRHTSRELRDAHRDQGDHHRRDDDRDQTAQQHLVGEHGDGQDHHRHRRRRRGHRLGENLEARQLPPTQRTQRRQGLTFGLAGGERTHDASERADMRVKLAGSCCRKVSVSGRTPTRE